jgi:hypothetical protein
VPPLVPNFDPNIRGCYMGDYDAVAVDTNWAYVQWSDNRNQQNGIQQPDMFLDRLSLAAPTPTPTPTSGPTPAQQATWAPIAAVPSSAARAMGAFVITTASDLIPAAMPGAVYGTGEAGPGTGDGSLALGAPVAPRDDSLSGDQSAPANSPEGPDGGVNYYLYDPNPIHQDQGDLAIIGQTLCAVYNDSATGIGYSVSTDAGSVWYDRGGLTGASSGASVIFRQADGYFYVSSTSTTGLQLYRSTDNCYNFTLFSTIKPGNLNDQREILRVDNTPSSPYYGRMVVCWTDFGAGGVIRTSAQPGRRTAAAPGPPRSPLARAVTSSPAGPPSARTATSMSSMKPASPPARTISGWSARRTAA